MKKYLKDRIPIFILFALTVAGIIGLNARLRQLEQNKRSQVTQVNAIEKNHVN